MHKFLFAGVCFFVIAHGHAADWAGWRGPEGLGVSPDSNLPIEWSRTNHVAWENSVPGRGASSPVVVGDRVILTSQTDDTELSVLAFDRSSGRLLWNRVIGRGKLPANQIHNMATPTAAANGQKIWVLFGTGDIAALNRDGEIVWQRNLVKEYGPYRFNHGYGSSPVFHDGALFIDCLHQGPSYVLSLDAETGRTLWFKTRNLEPKDEAQDSYSSPLLVRHLDRFELVVAGAETVNAYSPASGEQLWSINGFKVPNPYGRTIAGLTFGEGRLITVASGFQNQGYTVALSLSNDGSDHTPARLWTLRKFSPDCPTPLIAGKKVFLIRDDGMGSCLNLETGEPYWQERLFTENVKVSPVAGEGKVYFLSGQGNCIVVDAADTKFHVLSKNPLDEATLSTPAIAYQHLFIRTEKHLFCVGN